jgi:O-antigen/teichoic acid export membrane protein
VSVTGNGPDAEHRFRMLGRDFAHYGVMDLFSRATGLLLLPFFTRVFSVDEYGAIDVIAVVTVLLATLTRLALPSALKRHFIESRDSGELNRLYSSLLACVAGFALLVLAPVWPFAGAIADLLLEDEASATYVRLGLVTAALSSASAIPQTLLRMQRQITRFNLLNVGQAVTYAGLAVFFVVELGSGLVGVFAALAVAEAARLLLGLFWTRSLLTVDLSPELVRRSLRYSLPLLPGVLVGHVNRTADRFLLLMFLGIGGVSIFAVSARISFAVQVLATIFRQAWSPHAMRMIDSPAEERNDFYRRTLGYYAGALSLVGLAVTAGAPEILAVLVPPEYAAGYRVIPWLIGAAVLHASAEITNLGILISKRTSTDSVAAWSGATINVLLTLVLIPLFGIAGAAIGTFVGELVYTGALCHFTQRQSDLRFQIGAMLGVVVCYVVAAIALLIITATVESPLASLAARALVVGVAAAAILPLSSRRSASALER